MDAGSHLKYLLQSQLASDASAIKNLPHCLSSLTVHCLLPSSQSTKWTMRINSLLHSKESGARWAGLCLAYKTALLSQSLMIELSLPWIASALPVLTKSERLPTHRAAIRLLRVIFTTATDIPEFYRQVCVPNVVKFTSAIISLADNQRDIELNKLCLETITQVVTLYPTTHRPTSSLLNKFALQYLNGSSLSPTSKEMAQTASQLYAALPLTGGKVGAVNLWKKSVDEILAFGWEAFYCLRTTFPENMGRPVPCDEPQVAIPLNQDRLRCSVITLNSLFRAVIHRPVQIPFGSVVKFIVQLLSCSMDDKIDGFVDPLLRAMELAIVPEIWTLGCDLLQSVAEQFPFRLNPYAGRLFSIMAFQLDKKPEIHQRRHFLVVLDSLLKSCYPVHSSVITTRLAKLVLPSITTVLLPSTSEGVLEKEKERSSIKNRNSKKRAKNYEGDELFTATRQVLYTTVEEGDVFLISLDVMQSLFKNPNLSSPVQSIIARVVISILISLPRMLSSSLSQNPCFLQLVSSKVQKFNLMIGSGTTGVMSKTLPFVINATLTTSMPEIQHSIGMLLHPRVPPLVRSLPHVESLSLFKAEESQEEIESLANLDVSGSLQFHQTHEIQRDVIMTDEILRTHPIPSTHPQVLMTVPEQASVTRIIPPPPQPKETNHQMQVPHQYLDSRTDLPSSVQKFTTIGSFINPPMESSTSLSVTFPPQEGDDEEMPVIDMDSDSEVEED